MKEGLRILAVLIGIISCAAHTAAQKVTPSVVSPPSSSQVYTGTKLSDVPLEAGLATSPEGRVVTVASLGRPEGLVVTPSGQIYVSEGNRIRVISPDGKLSAEAIGRYDFGFSDGGPGVAQFHNPQGLACDVAGNVIVADADNNSVRKISPAGLVSTFAGSRQRGLKDGTASDAKFNYPRGLDTDLYGNIYIADRYNNCVRKITPQGIVSTLAEGFSNPRDVAADSSGNVYVADADNNRICKITPDGSVNVLHAGFNHPTSVAVDSAGNVYAGGQIHEIRKIAPDGSVITVTGFDYGFADGPVSAARFTEITSLAFDRSGTLFVSGLFDVSSG